MFTYFAFSSKRNKVENYNTIYKGSHLRIFLTDTNVILKCPPLV